MKLLPQLSIGCDPLGVIGCNPFGFVVCNSFGFRSGKGRRLAILVVLALIGCCCACRPGAKPNESLDDLAESHAHFPAHWPHTLHAAADRLAAWQSQPDLPPIQSGIDPRAELADLVRWLPILAADSDLGRSDFATIDTWSSSWTRTLEDAMAADRPMAEIVAIEEYRSMVRSLSEICQREEARLQRLQQ
jgi:hypothetical protein